MPLTSMSFAQRYLDELFRRSIIRKKLDFRGSHSRVLEPLTYPLCPWPIFRIEISNFGVGIRNILAGLGSRNREFNPLTLQELHVVSGCCFSFGRILAVENLGL